MATFLAEFTYGVTKANGEYREITSYRLVIASIKKLAEKKAKAWWDAREVERKKEAEGSVFNYRPHNLMEIEVTEPIN